MSPENPAVTAFLDELHHPLRAAIDRVRQTILRADGRLTETVKWNGPNYSAAGQDRLTLRIHPPTQLQLVFHRGAKPLPLPAGRLVADASGLLAWKANDRAVATFRDLRAVEHAAAALDDLVQRWLAATAAAPANR